MPTHSSPTLLQYNCLRTSSVPGLGDLKTLQNSLFRNITCLVVSGKINLRILKCHEPRFGGWLLSWSSQDRFLHSSVGECGSETFGRMNGKGNRDTKEIQRHGIVPGGQLNVYWRLNRPTCNFHMLLYLNTKGGKKAKDWFNTTQRTTRTVTCSTVWDIMALFPK